MARQVNAAAVLFAAAMVACSGVARKPDPPPKLNRWGKPWKEGIRVPDWVDKLPESGPGKLVAVGYSQPSFWPQDAIDAASADARGKLALALASHVEVLGIDTETGRGDRGAIIGKEATDAVLKNSRIEATWADENGERSDAGGVWALATLEIDSVRGRGQKPSPAPATQGKNGPAWLERLPEAKDKLYAVGYSGPTYHADDALRYASERAVGNLAASLRAHVQAYTLLVESASGLTIDQFARTEDPGQAFLDLVRKNAKVEATWVDRDGARPGDPPGAAWALAAIEVRSTKGSIDPVESDDLKPALDRQGNDPGEQ